jgi:hypothetical protein
MDEGFSKTAHAQIAVISITRNHSLHIWKSNECITSGAGLEENYNARSKQLNVCCANASKLNVRYFLDYETVQKAWK